DLRQDSLDEGRPGPRQADDEDRLVARIPLPRPREELLGARRVHAVEQRAVGLERVVERRALSCLARLEMRERGRVVAEILELLRKRVPKVQLAVDVLADGGEQRVQPIDMVLVRRLRARLREHAVRLVESRLERDRTLERGLGAGEIADDTQRRAEVVVE